MKYPFSGPPGLFVVGLALLVITLVLAYWGVPTVLLAALSAWCLTWAVLPPRRGLSRQKYQLLLVAFVVACLGTWGWYEAWS